MIKLMLRSIVNAKSVQKQKYCEWTSHCTTSKSFLEPVTYKQCTVYNTRTTHNSKDS